MYIESGDYRGMHNMCACVLHPVAQEIPSTQVPLTRIGSADSFSFAGYDSERTPETLVGKKVLVHMRIALTVSWITR